LNSAATTRVSKSHTLRGIAIKLATNLNNYLLSEESGLGLDARRRALGFENRSLGLVSTVSDLIVDWAVRFKLAILVQIPQKRGIILLAVMYVSEEEMSFRGIGLPANRLADAVLGFLQPVQRE
jgi:hypothetical protein